MQRPLPETLPLAAPLFALLFFTAAVQAQDPAEQGRALLERFCVSCHAVGKSDRSRNAGALPLRDLGRSYDLDRLPRLLQRGISSGHPAMPEFKFSEEDARAVSVYLRSIQQ